MGTIYMELKVYRGYKGVYKANKGIFNRYKCNNSKNNSKCVIKTM